MLSKILSKDDCAACRFCCSFRRQSLWETPLFTEEAAERLAGKYPAARFRAAGMGACTIDLSAAYQTDAPEEEAPCPFLGARGCTLPADEKPFDCSIWPLRAVRTADGRAVVALTPTCPAVNRRPRADVRALAASGLGARILDEAAAFPAMVKGWRDWFEIVYERG